MKKAYYRSIPAYYNEETSELKGRNWFWDVLIDINVWFDFEVLCLTELPIWIPEDENNQ